MLCLDPGTEGMEQGFGIAIGLVDAFENQRAPGLEGETTMTLDGMTPVDELKARLRLPDLPAEGSYHTLAGLLLALLGGVPRAGDRIVCGGWRFAAIMSVCASGR